MPSRIDPVSAKPRRHHHCVTLFKGIEVLAYSRHWIFRAHLGPRSQPVNPLTQALWCG